MQRWRGRVSWERTRIFISLLLGEYYRWGKFMNGVGGVGGCG
jgi:hypothetical protein